MSTSGRSAGASNPRLARIVSPEDYPTRKKAMSPGSAASSCSSSSFTCYSGRQSDERQRCETSVELRRKRPEAASIISLWRVSILKIPPALVRSARHGRNGSKLSRADNIDSPVLPVLDAQDVEACDDGVLHDPVEIAADQLIGAFGAHSRRNPDLAANRAPGQSFLQHFEVATGECDLGQMEYRHSAAFASRRREIKHLPVQVKHRGQSEEEKEAERVGHRRHEDRRNHSGIDLEPVEADRDQNARQTGVDRVKKHRKKGDEAQPPVM